MKILRTLSSKGFRRYKFRKLAFPENTTPRTRCTADKVRRFRPHVSPTSCNTTEATPLFPAYDPTGPKSKSLSQSARRAELIPISRMPQLDPEGNYDLIHAAAALSALEVRIGYSFSDKSLGMSAIKLHLEDEKLKTERATMSVGCYLDLALLGDKALELILCRTWYKTESTRSKCSGSTVTTSGDSYRL